MKTKLFMLICLMLSVTTMVAQECFTPTYNRGKELYSNGDYKRALTAFRAAVNCPDKPATNDLASWIKKTEQKIEVPVRQSDENRVYKQSEVDKLPLFPGGENVLNAFIKGEMQYPEVAKANRQEGSVVVKVTIDKTGKLANFKISETRYPILASEALRIVKQMPDWKPAEKRGKKVVVEYAIPIEFKLEKEKEVAVSEINPEGNGQTEEMPEQDIPVVASVHKTNNGKKETVVKSTAKDEFSFTPLKEFKRHQLSLDLGIGMLATSDDYGSWNSFSAAITAQYQYNLSKIVGLNLSAKILSDFSETSAYGAFAGIQLTTPNIGKKVSLYVLPKIGFVAYEDWGESGLTYEIGVGVNLSKRLYVGYSYMNTSVDANYGDYMYLFGFSNHSFLFGVRF